MIHRFGPPSTLKPEPYAPEPPDPGQVQVEMHYVGINFADLLERMGLYQAAPKRPFIPGFEGAGVVAAVGNDVTDVAPGDRVAVVSRFGAYQSHLTVPQENVFSIGPLTLREAAGFPVVYLTAWEALVGMARARAGDRVLIHGGAGGVGTAAIAIAKHLGLEVHATTGTPAKVPVLQDMRAAAYCTEDDWIAAVQEATGHADGGGIDIVLDSGGPASVASSLKVLAPRGRVVMYGAQAVAPGNRRNVWKAVKVLRASRFPLLRLLPLGAGVMAFHLLYMWARGVDLRADNDALLELVAAGEIARPVIDRAFDVEEVAAAHQYIHDRKNVGKVLLRFPAAGSD